METTMYRRRTGGRGSRTAGKRRSAAVSVREKRRLLQLCASVLLFLLVFWGKGLMPEAAERWGLLLNSDLDFGRVISMLGQTPEEGGGVGTALMQVMEMLNGGMDPTAEAAKEPAYPYQQRSEVLERIALQPVTTPEMLKSKGTRGNSTGDSGSTEEAAPGREPVVSAVAQAYDENGEKLPERVSLQRYELGLEETALPVMGTITSDFGYRDHPVSGLYSFHAAVDIGVDTGTEVLAFADGTVRYIGENGVFGLYVKLDHDNGVSTFYAHCEELLVGKGERVVCGQVIARSGETGNATGPHLHFSLEKDGIRLDPEYYLER